MSTEEVFEHLSKKHNTRLKVLLQIKSLIEDMESHGWNDLDEILSYKPKYAEQFYDALNYVIDDLSKR